MEAFKITFVVTTPEGVRTARSVKSFACTGWEAAEKGKELLLKNGFSELQFKKWHVLNPYLSHFMLHTGIKLTCAAK